MRAVSVASDGGAGVGGIVGVVGVVTGPAMAAGASASASEVTRRKGTVFTREFPFLGRARVRHEFLARHTATDRVSRTTPPVLPRYPDGLTPRCPRDPHGTGADHQEADG